MCQPDTHGWLHIIILPPLYFPKIPTGLQVDAAKEGGGEEDLCLLPSTLPRKNMASSVSILMTGLAQGPCRKQAGKVKHGIPKIGFQQEA